MGHRLLASPAIRRYLIATLDTRQNVALRPLTVTHPHRRQRPAIPLFQVETAELTLPEQGLLRHLQLLTLTLLELHLEPHAGQHTRGLRWQVEAQPEGMALAVGIVEAGQFEGVTVLPSGSSTCTSAG